jgi:hypothetical protein
MILKTCVYFDEKDLLTDIPTGANADRLLQRIHRERRLEQDPHQSWLAVDSSLAIPIPRWQCERSGSARLCLYSYRTYIESTAKRNDRVKFGVVERVPGRLREHKFGKSLRHSFGLE